MKTLLSDPDIVQLTNELTAKKRPKAEEKFQLVKLHHDRGNLEQAMELLLAMENEYPDFIPVYVALGDLCVLQKDYEQASQYYRTVYQLKPGLLDVPALLRYALCSYHLGFYDIAATLLRVSINEEPAFEPPYRLLLGIYEQTGDLKNATALRRKMKAASASFERTTYLGTYLRGDLPDFVLP